MDYSIIIPVHNEGEHIELFVEEFLDRLLPAVKDVLREVILVENGSMDNSLAACRRLEAAHPKLVRTFTIPRRSYGEAIKTGILAAQGSHLSILECDNSRRLRTKARVPSCLSAPSVARRRPGSAGARAIAAARSAGPVAWGSRVSTMFKPTNQQKVGYH